MILWVAGSSPVSCPRCGKAKAVTIVEALIELQDVDGRIRELEMELKDLPRRRALETARLSGVSADLKAAQAGLEYEQGRIKGFEDDAKALKGAKVDEKGMAHQEAIILSMTQAERDNPAMLNSSRKKRIAAGSGTSVVEVNRLLKQFDAMQQMVKQFSGKNMRKLQKKMGKMGGGFSGMGGFPGF